MSSKPVALITGGSQRLGAAIAEALAKAGYDIAIHFRNSAAAAEDCVRKLKVLGADAAHFQADLAQEAQCKALLPAVCRHFGRIDAVINNASLFEYDDVASFSYASMEAHWRSNTGPAILLARSLHEWCTRASTSACVINLLDQKLWNPNPDFLSYTLSKAALEAATTLLAQALAPRVRVCGLAPGVTLPSGAMSDEEFAAAHRQTILNRSSTPDDISRSVLFLLQSPAMTGTTLLVDGGQHLTPQDRDVMFTVKPQAQAE